MKDGHLEASDLMIGDWVYCRIMNSNARIREICLGFCNIITDHEYVCFADLFPIPLTQEILEKNGWYFDDLVYEWYSNNKAMKLYGKDCSSLSILDGSVVVGYVHELQHALRLCGLNELADSFKV